MRHHFVVLVCILLVISGCHPKNKDQFDRTSLLTNLGNNIIVPAYQNFNATVLVLKQKGDAFAASPSLTSLDSLKQAYLASYLSFQAVEAYDFSASHDLRTALNSFPADTAQMKSNILSGSYDFNTVNNLRAKGFPAIDYLLFATSAQEVVSLFTTDANAPNRKQYLNDVMSEITSKSNAASSEWSSTFIGTFIAASGMDVGSSVGMLVNDMSFEMERNRRERVGNSLGYVGSLSSGVLSPYSVEAYYSGYSKELLIENLQQSKTLYTGAAGNGFDDYLDYLNATYYNDPLSTSISHQFDVVIQAAQDVQGNFSDALVNDKPTMETLFLELKKLTVMLKVDMSSQLGVVINYSDNDGD